MGTKVTPVADFGQVSPPLRRQWLVLPVSPWEGRPQSRKGLSVIREVPATKRWKSGKGPWLWRSGSDRARPPVSCMSQSMGDIAPYSPIGLFACRPGLACE